VICYSDNDGGSTLYAWHIIIWF